MGFPIHRPRRLRKNELIRSMVRETSLDVKDMVQPFFVVPGEKVVEPVKAMPGVFRYSVDTLIEEVKKTRDLGIPAVILFGIPEKKDPLATGAYDDNGIIQRAVRAIKEKVDGILVITDVCLCEYTSHGHCGLVKGKEIVNDATLELLAKTAVSHARAGADIVAPSDMMDGRVMAIREALDREGFVDVAIMSYSAKYASSFYGPFREAAESAPSFGDRRSYQMDPANAREAIREVGLDIEEGADIVMVKPALSYLDIIRVVRDSYLEVPIAAYSVSGEYSMIKIAGEAGVIDYKSVVLEVLTSIKRAGADIIITYFANEVATWLR
ncbi:MAG: porphobilinogen synthase [Thermosulfidibacteraceae bacterium]|jgi:porphobilinogen synthase